MALDSNPLMVQNLATVARVVHEAVRAYQTALGEQAAMPWEDAETWQREATLAAVRFCLAHPEAPASAMHDAWVREKIASGWRYGAVKDAAAKIHPSLVAFDRLPETEQRKDTLIQGIVTALVGPARPS